MIKYSIIIPTYNNAKILKICLEHILKLNKPEFEYEVLVIDNGSKDETKEIIKSFENRIPKLRYFYDETPGQLTGRHVGAKNASGEILCYIDDDSFVDKNWLTEIEKTFSNSEVVLAGGNDLPLFEGKAEKWTKYFWQDFEYGRCLCDLSLIDFFEKEMKVPTWYVFGCNFIIKKQILFENGGFNPDVMPATSQRFQGDGETALSLKLNKSGHVAYINPKIKIRHFVSKNRMTVEYFKKRAFYQGVSDSFSKIRKENGFEYYDFTPNNSCDKIRLQFFKRKYNRLFKKHVQKFVSIFDSNYKFYLNIKEEAELSYNEGFDFHQNEVKSDPELLKWILKENYID